MPRAVPPWLHRICIRRFSEPDPFKKLVLYTVNAFMDDAGETDVGQQAIAKAAAMGVSTVREKTSDLSKTGWLALYMRGQSGRKWKSYVYRACVPDSINLDQIPVRDTTAAAIADHHESVHGVIEPNTVRGTLYPQKGKRRAPPRAGGSKTQAPPAEPHEHRQLSERLPPANGNEHRQLLGGKSSLKVFSESDTRKGALARTDVALANGKTVPEKTEAERAEEQRAREARKLEALAKMLRAGHDPELCVRSTHSYGTTLADIPAARQWIADHDL